MNNTTLHQERLRFLLRRLGFAPNHAGYRILLSAIPLYAENNTRYISKELYPTLARQFGYFKITGIERSIRYAISEAWATGDPELWGYMFPAAEKAPSNSLFLATLSESIE